MLFFDDEERNLDNVKALGVVTCLVDRQRGFSGEALLRGLTTYFSSQRSQAILTEWLSSPVKCCSNEENLLIESDAKPKRCRTTEGDEAVPGSEGESAVFGAVISDMGSPKYETVVLCSLPANAIAQQNASEPSKGSV
jgi:hypothetical protein